MRRMCCAAASENIITLRTLADADMVVTAETPLVRIWEEMESSCMRLGLYCLLPTDAEANRDRAAANAVEMPRCQQELSGLESCGATQLREDFYRCCKSNLW